MWRGRRRRREEGKREEEEEGGGKEGEGRRDVEREGGGECLCLDSASHSISFLAVSGEQRSDKPHHSTSPWLGVRDPPVP